MFAHGTQPPPRPFSSPDRKSGGLATHSVGVEPVCGVDNPLAYKGIAGKREATEKMLSRLVTRMRYGGFQWPGGWIDGAGRDDNREIPAGYTYLAQLVAHDFVENTAQLPLIGNFPGDFQSDYRTQRLVLDTIYGGGPARDPQPYSTGGPNIDDRCLLRLGHVRATERPPPGSTNLPLVDQPPRDIARASCPFLNDRPNRVAPRDVLIADSRNDQHLIISQMTALFHELHNIVYAIVRPLQDAPSLSLVLELNLPRREVYLSNDAFRLAQAQMAFLQTRKLIAYVYRRVVLLDLLKLLLEDGVWRYYSDTSRRFPQDLLVPVTGNRVPLEFSHAAFRFGHVMVRFSYRLNEGLKKTLVSDPSIEQLLVRTSGRRADLMPIAKDWVIDWSHFFDLGDGQHINASRLISPYVAHGPISKEAVLPEEKDRDGGLFYRDLVRGYEGGVESVNALINRMRPSERDRSDLLKDQNEREFRIGEWLNSSPYVRFAGDELTSLTKDPPLLFFILFEAAYTQAGKKLGILGSTLVADVFFSALKANEHVIEKDPAVTILAQHVFGAKTPASMPDLIAFMKARGGLQNVAAGPNV